MSNNDEEKPLPKPVNYDELFPGRFLKAGLFKGKPRTFTIKDVQLDRLPTDYNKKRIRGVILFKETELQLCLNSTNGQCFKAMFGKQVQQWIGKRVTLRPETDKFGDETVDAIRVEGSPDIEDNVTVTITLPRKRPRERLLTVTRKNGSQQQPEAPKQQSQQFNDADEFDRAGA